MQSEHVDTLLVSHLPNVFYLTGFTGSNAALLISSSQAILFTDPRYTTQAKREVFNFQVRIAGEPPLVAAAKALGGSMAGRTGFEASRITVSQKQSLASSKTKGIRWVPWDGRIEAERQLKGPSEITAMRESASIACAALSDCLALVKPGVKESDLAAEIEYRMRLLGAEGPAFDTIVASGERSAWPHARASCKLIEKNELVVFDLGAILRGYCSDLTRTVFVGRAPKKVRRWYGAVLEAQEAAKAATQPGVSAGNIDMTARRVLRRAGLGEKFIHSTGHGLGLEVHEPPRLARGEESVLSKNMVVTIEPGVYFEGQGGIRIEDDALVTE